MNIPIIFLLAVIALSAVIGFIIGVIVQSKNGSDGEDW